MSRHRWWGRVTSVRFRAATAALLVVAVTLLVAGVAFVVLQRNQLEASLTDLARQQAADLAARVRSEGVGPGVGSVSGGEVALVQVVSSSGAVLASSPTIEGEPPVLDVAPPPGRVLVSQRSGLPIGEEEPFVVVARGVQPRSGSPVVVLVARSLESVEQATSVLAGLLAVGYPLLLLVVWVTSYWLTGRALAPVEAMRVRVSSIGDTHDLSPRVPVPPGEDEIARLARTMNGMLGRIEQAVHAQRRFVGDASHELRSPLATIRAAHEVAALHPEVTDWDTTSREVVGELDRLDRLVADLLLLARGDEDELRLTPGEVDLDDLVRAEAGRLRHSGLEVTLSAPPTRVRGDLHALSRCVRNLTDNAARHAATEVRLVLQSEPTEAVIEVIDDGPGIPVADRDRVFERFVRLDQSRARHSGGTGLGLPIARQIARAHGGDVEIVDSPSGAHLRLRLPL